jgi:uncharacterized membrane protein
MTESLWWLAALASALMAGLFFAFSVAVMKALGALPAAQGIAAMQSINRAILNPVFLAVFLGSGVLCAAIVVVALWQRGGGGAAWAIAGSVLYLAGAVLVTMLCNVPRNNALAAAAPDSTDAAALWRDYLVRWTAWNHLRCIASLVASACFIVAMMRPS